jgi:hypothetical protein
VLRKWTLAVLLIQSIMLDLMFLHRQKCGQESRNPPAVVAMGILERQPATVAGIALLEMDPGDAAGSDET